MTHVRYLKDLTAVDGIIPVPEEVGERLMHATQGGDHENSKWSVAEGIHIDTSNSVTYKEFVSEHATVTYTSWPYRVVRCLEHEQYELVPSDAYFDGAMRCWYDVGLHPRFGLIKPLYHQLKMPLGTIQWMTRRPLRIIEGRWQPDPDEELSLLGRAFKDAAHTLVDEGSTDPDRLVELMRPGWRAAQPQRITANGRRATVDPVFAAKYRAADFTVEEFLTESNQERRRLMIHSRAFSIEDVVGKMTTLAKDEEAEILYHPMSWREHYLHVVCATTAEHYLLGIPTQLQTQWAMPSDRNKLTWTPSEARRWTFNLPADAVLVAEA